MLTVAYGASTKLNLPPAPIVTSSCDISEIASSCWICVGDRYPRQGHVTSSPNPSLVFWPTQCELHLPAAFEWVVDGAKMNGWILRMLVYTKGDYTNRGCNGTSNLFKAFSLKEQIWQLHREVSARGHWWVAWPSRRETFRRGTQ